ncbi:hypothetical protein [Christiangramia sp. SM2212]|uniref:Uncharacterized protein n=1 Tax=Christiangramia sediminicola TaxID=3073267 RepID=A0ABU1ERJ9_9FLAO|nr:hypothetical protein [Christiangramia sp. SM2212]MDR5591001.1 hypothetical protein [Christiangramia sp. SM2212]
MTLQDQLNHKFESGLLFKRGLSAAGIAILIASVLIMIFGNEGNLVWIALTTTAIAGFGAGIFYYLLNDFLQPNGLKNVLAKIFSLLVFAASFWLALIFALAQVGLWD